jgi:hypothetical protein
VDRDVTVLAPLPPYDLGDASVEIDMFHVEMGDFRDAQAEQNADLDDQTVALTADSAEDQGELALGENLGQLPFISGS